MINMKAAALLFLLLPLPAEGDDAVLSALRYLARHQNKNGSWGGSIRRCTCPVTAPKIDPKDLPDEKTRKKIADLIDRFGEDSIEAREKAQEELRKIGKPATRQLMEALKLDHPETRARCGDLIEEIVRNNRVADLEITALSLITFLGAGYSHLSKDKHDGICFGDVVRRCLQYLLKTQRPDGSFHPKDDVANAIAALAMAEAYGLTGSNLFKDQAQRAVLYFNKVKIRGRKLAAWVAMLSSSATLSGLRPINRTRMKEVEKLLKDGKDVLSRAAYALHLRWTRRKADDGRIGDLLKIETKNIDPNELTFLAGAIILSKGGGSKEWKLWSEPNLKAVLPHQNLRMCERGSWDTKGLRGRIYRTAQRGLFLETFYRSTTLFGRK